VYTDLVNCDRDAAMAWVALRYVANAINKGTVLHRKRGVPGGAIGGATKDGAVVASVTVAVTGVTPSLDVTDVGAAVQVELVGAPVQASATACLNPPAGVTVTIKVPLVP
jgi:hypothetical protein